MSVPSKIHTYVQRRFDCSTRVRINQFLQKQKHEIVIFRRKIRRKIRDSATRGRKVPCSYSTHTILLTILHIIRVDKIFRPSCGLEVFFLFFFDPCRAAAIPAMVFDECTLQSALEKPVPGTRGVHCPVRDS